MKLVNKFRFYIGLLIVLFLVASYFLKIEIDSGANYTVTDSLLGIIIFHSFFVLVAYSLIALFFLVTGFKRIKVE